MPPPPAALGALLRHFMVRTLVLATAEEDQYFYRHGELPQDKFVVFAAPNNTTSLLESQHRHRTAVLVDQDCRHLGGGESGFFDFGTLWIVAQDLGCRPPLELRLDSLYLSYEAEEEANSSSSFVFHEQYRIKGGRLRGNRLAAWSSGEGATNICIPA